MKRSKSVVLLLSIIILGIIVTPLTADPLNDAIKKQRQIEQSRKQAESKLKNLKNLEQIKKRELNKVVQQLVVARSELVEAEENLNEAEEAVRVSEAELEVKKQELADRQEALRNRVRNIYEEGTLSYLDILLASADVGEFISNIEYFSYLVKNDQTLLADVEEKKQFVEAKTEELREERDNAVIFKQQAVQAKLSYDQKKQTEQKYLAEIKESQDAIFTQIEKLEADSKKLEDTIRKLQAANKNGVVGTIRIWPLPGYYNISSAYGWRTHPITRKRSLHTGTDIPAPFWTKILAAGEGTVIYSGWYSAAYGYAVIIDHGNGMSTMYPHQVKVAVKYGDIVKAGQVVGYVGSSGWSTGPHTHFEVRKNGVPVNPLDFY